MKRSHVLGWRRRLVELALVTCATCGAVLTMPGASPHIVAATPAAVDPVSNWNVIALQAAATAGEGPIVQSRTLAIVQALLVRVAGGIYALPIHAVTETLRVEPNQIHRVNQREAIMLRETILPLVALRHVFGADDAAEHEVGNADGSRLVVAVHTTAQHARQVGLVVEGLIGEQEIVIKPLGHLVGDIAGVSGAAILGDGSVALIVDVAALIAQAIRRGR